MTPLDAVVHENGGLPRTFGAGQRQSRFFSCCKCLAPTLSMTRECIDAPLPPVLRHDHAQVIFWMICIAKSKTR